MRIRAVHALAFGTLLASPLGWSSKGEKTMSKKPEAEISFAMTDILIGLTLVLAVSLFALSV